MFAGLPVRMSVSLKKVANAGFKVLLPDPDTQAAALEHSAPSYNQWRHTHESAVNGSAPAENTLGLHGSGATVMQTKQTEQTKQMKQTKQTPSIAVPKLNLATLAPAHPAMVRLSMLPSCLGVGVVVWVQHVQLWV